MSARRDLATCLTVRLKFARGMRRSVEFWYRRISFNASAPGRNLFVLLFSLFLSTVLLLSWGCFGGVPDLVEMSIGGRSRVGAVARRALIVFLAVCLKRALVYHDFSGVWTLNTKSILQYLR